MILGLTGGIASGKSTVAELLAELGANIIDADQVSRDLMGPGSPVFSRIVEAFGQGVLNGDGSLNRVALGQIVFADPERRRQLEELTHPPIWEEMRRRLEVFEKQGGTIVLMVPLLLENGREQWVDQVWVVDIPESVQLDRLQLRNGLTRQEAEARLAAQMKAADRRAKADVIIDNSGTQEETAQQVRSAWNRYVTTPSQGAPRQGAPPR